ncbi:MAG: precorrin-2 dehydrogenase/sirohydrochlorin ferrochelatase family protein [Acidimicrobiales bacterium]
MPVDEPLYPVNLRVAGRRCLVVGGGPVALSKVRGLLEAEASVTVIAPAVVAELDALAESADVTIERRAYAPGDLAGVRLVITATDDPAVNEAIYREGEAVGVWVNSADDPANCAFTLPARVRQGPLLVTFATGGRSPALATWLRRSYAAEFGPEYVTLIDMLAAERDHLRSLGRSTEGLDWQAALDSGMLDLIREGRLAEAKERLQACLSSSSV